MLGATRTISSALSRPTRVLSPRSTRQLFTSSKNVLEKLFRLRENAGSYSDESISLKNPISSQIIQPGSVGFGFSAGGLLFPYYIGVIEELHILGVLTSPVHNPYRCLLSLFPSFLVPSIFLAHPTPMGLLATLQSICFAFEAWALVWLHRWEQACGCFCGVPHCCMLSQWTFRWRDLISMPRLGRRLPQEWH